LRVDDDAQNAVAKLGDGGKAMLQQGSMASTSIQAGLRMAAFTYSSRI